jgi:hypothetical protein
MNVTGQTRSADLDHSPVVPPVPLGLLVTASLAAGSSDLKGKGAATAASAPVHAAC